MVSTFSLKLILTISMVFDFWVRVERVNNLDFQVHIQRVDNLLCGHFTHPLAVSGLDH